MQSGTLSLEERCPESTLPGKFYLLMLKKLSHKLCRNFAATQVLRVPGAVHDKFSSKLEAVNAFENARADGLVEVL